MAGTSNSVKGVLADFLMPILPKTVGEPTRESLIKIHPLISESGASVASNLGEGWHGHLALTMTAEEYLSQTGHVFVPPHNLNDQPPTMGTVQDQAPGTKRFYKNKHFSNARLPFLLPITEHLTESVQVMTLEFLQHLFRLYGSIKKIDLKENVVNIIGPYDPA